MLKRLLIGLVKGVLVGGVLGVVLVKGLGVAAMGVWVAYLLAVIVGVLSGLVAGKPIWAEGARIEAGLKAVVGALLGAGLMYAARRWLGVHVDLGQFGHGSIAELPIVSLPLIAMALSMLYELDNTGDDEDDKAKAPGKAKKRVGATADDDEQAELEDELEGPSKKARRRG
jgi:hypothetical protein